MSPATLPQPNDFILELTEVKTWLAQEFDPIDPTLRLQVPYWQLVIDPVATDLQLSFKVIQYVEFLHFTKGQTLFKKFSFQAIAKYLSLAILLRELMNS